MMSFFPLQLQQCKMLVLFFSLYFGRSMFLLFVSRLLIFQMSWLNSIFIIYYFDILSYYYCQKYIPKFQPYQPKSVPIPSCPQQKTGTAKPSDIQYRDIKMSSQAIFDISLTISTLRNLNYHYTPKFNFTIRFQITGLDDEPCPYSLSHAYLPNWESTINLYSYLSGALLMTPMQVREINETCIWRGSLPITHFQHLELLCFVQFGVENTVIQNCYKICSCLGVQSFLPIFQNNIGVEVSAVIETQMLGIRIQKNYEEDRLAILYRGIECLFQESNRLNQRIHNHESENEQNKTIASMSTFLERYPLDQPNEKLFSYIHQQFQRLKWFRNSRILNEEESIQHMAQVNKFVNQVRGQYTNILMLNWQKYLKLVSENPLKQLSYLKLKYTKTFSQKIQKILNQRSPPPTLAYPINIGHIKQYLSGIEIAPLQFQQRKRQHSIITELLQPYFDVKKVIVLVHGLGGNSTAMRYIEKNIRFIYPHIYVLNSSANQAVMEDIGLEEMGKNLAIEVLNYVKDHHASSDFQISFIAHSLGGLVVRAALPYLEVLRLSMNSFITMATPHLGHIQHSNTLAKIGMVAINSFSKSKIFEALLLEDQPNARDTILYKLSSQSCLGWFKQLTFYGCQDDGYVSADSSVAEVAIDKLNDSQITRKMSENMWRSMSSSNVNRFMIRFNHENTNIQEMLVGRSSHLAFVSSQHFITLMLLQNYANFCLHPVDNSQ